MKSSYTLIFVGKNINNNIFLIHENVLQSSSNASNAKQLHLWTEISIISIFNFDFVILQNYSYKQRFFSKAILKKKEKKVKSTKKTLSDYLSYVYGFCIARSALENPWLEMNKNEQDFSQINR